MPPQIIKTKISIPVADAKKIARPFLLGRLNDASRKKLTILSAPAGYGKTTILIQWVRSTGKASAWVSLDKRDDDLTVFWTYILSSLQQLDPDLGRITLDMLDSIVPAPITSALTPLLNEIAEGDRNFLLILDDYHLIQSSRIHDSLSFFIDHMPPQIRMIIATRTAPPIPVSRLRVENELEEIGIEALRFSKKEIGSFLKETTGVDLPSAKIDIIETRLEGWAAGLQLAAISIREKNSPGQALVSFFVESHHFIGTYLLEEIFLQLADPIQDFLLQTSILNRLSSPLCDAITGRKGSQAILEELYDRNLFIIPLDTEQSWYRYHHLFRDFLEKRLTENQPEILHQVHRRAGRWFEENNFKDEAVHHAFESGNIKQAVKLIEQFGMNAIERGQSPSMVYHWLKKLPENIILSNPLFLIFQTAILLFEKGALVQETITRQLNEAKRIVTALKSSQGKNNIHPIDYNLIESAIITLKTSLSLRRGDIPEKIIELGKETLSQLDEDFVELRSHTLVNIFMAYLSDDNLEKATHILDKLHLETQKKEIFYIQVLYKYLQAYLSVTKGKLNAAAMICKEGIAYTTSKQIKDPANGIIPVCLGYILFEQNELKPAEQLIEDGISLAQKATEWLEIVIFGYVILVRLKMATMHNTDEVLPIINKIAKMDEYRKGAKLLATSLKINLLLRAGHCKKGNIQIAWDLVRQYGLPLDIRDPFIPGHFLERRWRREMQYSQIKVYIAQGMIHQSTIVKQNLSSASTFLRHQLQSAKQNGNAMIMIETQLLSALIAYVEGRDKDALVLLQETLCFTEPEKYVRIFVDKGTPMAELLKLAVREGISTPYSSRLLAVLKQELPVKIEHGSADNELVEPLSKREQEVLRLIAAGLSNKDIAENLFLARNTIKRHISNIYGKLGVNNRVKAASKAKSLNLL